jgi:hypothetical protein
MIQGRSRGCICGGGQEATKPREAGGLERGRPVRRRTILAGPHDPDLIERTMENRLGHRVG